MNLIYLLITGVCIAVSSLSALTIYSACKLAKRGECGCWLGPVEDQGDE